MSTSVRWLLAQRRLELELRGGADGLDRPMDCAVSSELVTAADWMVGGEVLLTTGLRLPDDPPIREQYVESLADVGVAAIGFGVGLGYEEIPPEICAAADRVGLPLFEVPWHIPFSAITRAVLDHIAAGRSARLVAATRAQPRMTRAAVARGPAAVISELADAVASRVILLDAAHAEVAAAPGGAAAPADLDHVRTLAARDPASAGAVVVTDDATVTLARIGSSTTTFGFLGVVGPTLDEVARMLVGHAVSLLAIEYAKPRDVRRDIARVQSDVLGNALDGVVGATARSILERVATPDGRVRAVVYTFADDASARRGADRLADELESRWRPVFVFCDGTEVVVLLDGDDHVDVAVGMLNLLVAQGPLRGGIGPAVALADADGAPRPDAIAESVAHARLAARSAATGQLVDLAATRSLLGIPEIRNMLADSRSHRLRPIIEHDREQGAGLEASLLAFLEANGNWGAAATTIGVHRHTLRSRVERIEDMLGIDLTDARTRAELLLMMLGADA
ncbi:PucR family transcriptional regulator [Gordonia sp. VNQ95]|jgi:purine catabolism regulator|uniref:PucR family transcriptional regulator n=1 Tax=Gordonia TaxID=2053 RepID=UPI0032B533F7